jgi:FkbM family methyltransferase
MTRQVFEPTERNRARMLKVLSGSAPDDIARPDIVRLDYPDHNLYLYVTSKVERRSRVLSCAKEPWTVEWIHQNVSAGDVVYDIGANVGPYSLIAATRVVPGGRVVAFEPGYASYAHLCDNVVLNGLAETILPVPLPLSSRTALGTFEYHRLTPGHARHAVTGERADGANRRDQVFQQQVMTLTVDDSVRVFGVPHPNHIKMDVDGWEAEILAGASMVLDSPVLRTILMELEVVNSDLVERILARHGFALERRFQREVDGQPVGWWTGLFRRRS